MKYFTAGVKLKVTYLLGFICALLTSSCVCFCFFVFLRGESDNFAKVSVKKSDVSHNIKSLYTLWSLKTLEMKKKQMGEVDLEA